MYFRSGNLNLYWREKTIWRSNFHSAGLW